MSVLQFDIWYSIRENSVTPWITGLLIFRVLIAWSRREHPPSSTGKGTNTRLDGWIRRWVVLHVACIDICSWKYTPSVCWSGWKCVFCSFKPKTQTGYFKQRLTLGLATLANSCPLDFPLKDWLLATNVVLYCVLKPLMFVIPRVLVI